MAFDWATARLYGLAYCPIRGLSLTEAGGRYAECGGEGSEERELHFVIFLPRGCMRERGIERRRGGAGGGGGEGKEQTAVTPTSCTVE